MAGCGQPGAEIWAVAYEKDALRAAGPFLWPDGPQLNANIDFTTTSPAPFGPDTLLYGTVLDANGEHVPPGARLEAYVGDTLCAASSLPVTEMDWAGSDRYVLMVSGPADIPSCDAGAQLDLRVNGIKVAQTAINDGQEKSLDLVVE
jgi:hypothetical protein